MKEHWEQRQGSLHTSNKTRIETRGAPNQRGSVLSVLYIHPIKQGLKLITSCRSADNCACVLYIHPIKQGLKLPHLIFHLVLQLFFTYIQ